MYISTPPAKKKCSKCGTIENTEEIVESTKNSKTTFIKCKNCGHQNVQSILTWTDNEEALTMEATKWPEFQEF